LIYPLFFAEGETVAGEVDDDESRLADGADTIEIQGFGDLVIGLFINLCV